jgi:hypothetical protein
MSNDQPPVTTELTRVVQRIKLDGVADAHRALERGGLDGKVVIVP